MVLLNSYITFLHHVLCDKCVICFSALGVPVTDHTYDDCRLMMKARKLNLPMDTGLVEFQKLHKKLG